MTTEVPLSIRSTFAAFRVAYSIRTVVQSLRDTNPESNHILKMGKTKVDEDFISYCRKEFEGQFPKHPGCNELPLYRRNAEDYVMEAVESVRGKHFNAVVKPIGSIIKTLVPPLIDFATACRIPLEQKSRESLDDWIIRLQQIPTSYCSKDWKAVMEIWKTVNTLYNDLQYEMPGYDVRSEAASNSVDSAKPKQEDGCVRLELWVTGKRATGIAQLLTGDNRDWPSYWRRFCMNEKHAVRTRPASTKDGTPAGRRIEVEAVSLFLAIETHIRKIKENAPEDVKLQQAVRAKLDEHRLRDLRDVINSTSAG